VVWLRNKFLAGLALALPLVITFAILQFIDSLLHGWTFPIVSWFADLVNELAGETVVRADNPYFILMTRVIGVLLPLVVLIGLGVMATNVIGVHVVTAVDRLLLRVPFVSFIYKSLKQVIDSFKTFGGARNFKRVAYIDYPMPGMQMLGFVTGGFTDPASGKAKTTVFVPTAPNPMSGILLVVDSERVTDAAISLEDSMKMIFSAGLVAPYSPARPLNQRPEPEALPPGEVIEPDSAPAPEPAPAGPLAAEAEDAGGEPEAFVNLPRAEDFDSGDPDILSDADDVSPAEREQQASRRGVARLASKVLPWRRR
jgi:uncharacterized membrane protein